MILDERSTKKSKQETNLRSDSKLYLDGPTYNGPTYEGQAKCFSSRSLLGLPRLLNKCVTDQFRMALARGQISLSFVSIIKLTTRMAAVHKATVSAVHKITLSLVHKTTLLAMRIKPTKAVTTLSRWTLSLRDLLPLFQETIKKLRVTPPDGAYPGRFYN